jgi:HAD superfamily hydrolase (TIGR01509 family)
MILDLRALIFDVDGTLAETEEYHRLSFNAAFAQAGLNWTWGPELYRELLAVAGGKERIRCYMDRLETPLSGDGDLLIRDLHARKTALYAAFVAAGAIPLRPGIAELLAKARARGVALAIATTTSRPNVEALLQTQLGSERAHCFAVMICGDEVAAKKPAPDVYLAALQALGVSASQALAIEDSANGVQSARRAGVAVIATPSFYSAEDDFTCATAIAPETATLSSLLGWN